MPSFGVMAMVYDNQDNTLVSPSSCSVGSVFWVKIDYVNFCIENYAEGLVMCSALIYLFILFI